MNEPRVTLYLASDDELPVHLCDEIPTPKQEALVREMHEAIDLALRADSTMTTAEAKHRYDAWGLFEIDKRGPDDYAVTVLGYTLAKNLSQSMALSIYSTLVQQATALDGNAGALAIAWSTAAAAQVNLSTVQARCTELIQEQRDITRKLKTARNALYRAKFATEQDTNGSQLVGEIIKALDATRDEDVTPVFLPPQ